MYLPSVELLSHASIFANSRHRSLEGEDGKQNGDKQISHYSDDLKDICLNQCSESFLARNADKENQFNKILQGINRGLTALWIEI